MFKRGFLTAPKQKKEQREETAYDRLAGGT